jgi:hypothetical protein
LSKKKVFTKNKTTYEINVEQVTRLLYHNVVIVAIANAKNVGGNTNLNHERNFKNNNVPLAHQ